MLRIDGQPGGRKQPPNVQSMLERLTTSLGAQALEPSLIVDLTGRTGKVDQSVRLWRRVGPRDAFASSEHPLHRSELIRPDGDLEVRSLFADIETSSTGKEPRVVAIPQALAGPETLAQLAQAD